MPQQTLGRMLIDDALPASLRGSYGELDKRELSKLLERVAREYPQKYADVSHKLSELGRTVAYRTGGTSFGLRHLQRAQAATDTRTRVQTQLQRILDNDYLTDQQRSDMIVRAAGQEITPQQEAIYKESLAEGNPLAHQILSGTRGNKQNLVSLRGSDLLYVDHRDRTIPLPVLHSYSEGLTPAEYWAGTYGARKGVLSTKLATADTGYYGKIINRASHRLVVTDLDSDHAPRTLRGLPVDTSDPDNEGALLAKDVGGFPRNTILTPRILQQIGKSGHDRILVRSPIASAPPDGGVYARDVGLRETGAFPGRGDQIGLLAAQALAEPLTQGALSEKHRGGVAGGRTSGFEYIKNLVNVPKTFPGSATHSQKDGRVARITEAPAGGHFVHIEGEQHYVPADQDVTVKAGDPVEAGDVLSNGAPRPDEIVKHKHIGEGQRYFTKAYVDAYKNSGIRVHRRNVELLAKGLINHVRLTGEVGTAVPDDVIHYDSVETQYEPRDDAEEKPPRQAIGKYLERPYLHYSVGTKVRPSVFKELQHFGVPSVTVHKDPPPFEPEMIRGTDTLSYDPDFMTQQLGSGLKSTVLDAVHRGAHSNRLSTSFVPSLAYGSEFGREGLVAVKH